MNLETDIDVDIDVDMEEENITKPDYLVAIGASAGGLEALEELIFHMPLETGMAFVIVQHLSPDYKSLMDELLSRKTTLPVVMAQDQMRLQANAVYLLPPQKEMMVSNGRLLLTERDSDNQLNLPINIFFNSLAESYQDKGIAIILSGSGSDGTKGIQAVHDSGGMVIAQSPDSCKFDSMPNSAINTHKVDLVLAPRDIPEALVKFSKRNRRVDMHITSKEFDLEEGQFTEILMLINSRFDLDFSQYKTSTITRRIERRMGLLSLPSLKGYLKVLKEDKDELEAMYFDLLIGVTQFFRDPEAFSSLKAYLPKILQVFEASRDEEFRVWVPACATGEEAYTFAIILSDWVSNSQKPFRFKIFATDIHSKSIKKAASGVYTETGLKGLSEEHRKKYFIRLDSPASPSGSKALPQLQAKYQVNKILRQHVVFAQHNIIRDAPFTKTHIISCRNMLIYFNLDTQKKVLSLLTFALKNKGLLFLGPSETLGRHSVDFNECDSTHKIYQKMRESQRRLPIDFVNSPPRLLPSIQHSVGRDQTVSVKSKKALNVLLQRYVPPSLLINTSGDILHTFGNAADYLRLTPGEASMNLRVMVDGTAKAVVVQMLNHVNKLRKSVYTRCVEGFSQCDSADLTIQPLSELPSDADYLLVTIAPNFKPSEADLLSEKEVTEVTELEKIPEAILTPRVVELEEELQFTRENLQTTVEELETSNEELQSSNEELMASNEELQSTNEELQSVNEELVTVNAEYHAKEKERAEIAADEKSIIKASGIGIIFLDENLHIRRFSDTAANLFHLVSGDYDRPFEAVSGNLVESVVGDVQNVLQQGSIVEREVCHEDGGVYQMRIHRIEDYSEEDDPVIRGVILTFTNITKLSMFQRNLQKTENRFQSMVDTLSDGYFEWKPEVDTLYISNALKLRLGYKIEDILDWRYLLSEESQTILNTFLALQSGDSTEQMLALKHHDGSLIWFLCKCRASQKRSTDFSLEGQLVDMQKFKRLEGDLQEQMKKLHRSNDILEEFAYIVSHDLKAPLRHSLHTLNYLCEAKKVGNTEDEEVQIGNLKAHLQSLQVLIDDVIRFSQFRTQTKKVSEQNLNTIIAEVKPVLESNFKAKKIDIDVEQLPIIRCDRSMMRHLFQNILHNACKYNDNDCVVINIQCRLDKSFVTISFQDNGIGFDPRFADDIFKPFKRLVTKSQFEGSGVGLAICKTIAEQHDGTITAKSGVGKGSLFIVTLPI